jgi:predicted enzyme related to lactoylglutathione lyase
MTFVQKHPHGQFCWLDLGTTDRKAAVAFYSQLFGWSSVDAPMDKGVYTMFKFRDHDTGAVYEMDKEMLSQGIPPHWMLYVSVDNVDDAASRVPGIGGKVLMGPFDVFTVGRMAIAQDPQGATFAMWQAKDHTGLGVKDEPGAFCWPELNTSDAAAAVGFYNGLFGWGHKTDPKGFAEGYTEWKMVECSIGGLMQIRPEWGQVPPHWMPYFQVADCDATVAQAQKLGAQAIVAPMDVPNVGRFAVLRDPQGAHFSIIRLGSA